ncbi:aspartate/tyrosine/aromatic aminotransferase [Aestuariicella hydrocarbonica]|uniref:Aminotransferase n=1 Tax=Pseudomaricurvus hydrocarbonicus TaxID=1470433 RepID=A0A9E5JP46_9GAMM|nr:amino acid aminotransferase [Aestuariicella hydrocarbonica]NHO64002.1 aspartate/tyrosine/aromatic aminotransferase [Aestuariicella hydrocarbonica]
MFEQFEPLATDPILGLSLAYQQDTNPHKVDLGVGVYKDEAGNTPVLQSVTAAQVRCHAQETTKAYQSPAGDVVFNTEIQKLIFGADSPQLDRLKTLQTPGGCGALRVAAEVIVRAAPGATIWVSRPTWANHIPLLSSAGLKIKEYPYYQADTQSLDVEGMLACLAQVPAGDLVLLHGCCHNPCGTDLTLEHWQAIADLANKQGFTPFVDLAYQGFGEGLNDDAQGLRLLADAVPEMLVASSCSKNFGLYRERVGALSVVGSTVSAAANTFGQMQSVARGIYSMPPSHGAALVATILTDAELRQQWEGELAGMRIRIKQLRENLAAALVPYGDFSFIPRQRGMFSFLGLNETQVERLKTDFSVYMVGSSRINLAGINQSNLMYLAESIGQVL